MNKMKYFFCILLALLFISCSATKKVPSGSYLLNKVKIDTDIKVRTGSEAIPQAEAQLVDVYLRKGKVARLQHSQERPPGSTASQVW